MMLAAEKAASAGHVIDWISTPVADAWRTGLWVVSILLVVRLISWSIKGRNMQAPTASVIGRVALAIFVLRSAFSQAENWHATITYEGMPITTLCVILSWWATVLAIRWEKEHDRY